MDDKTLIAIVASHFHERVAEVHHITGKGQVNDVAILTTTSQTKYVIRIDPNETSTARFDKESWCMEQAQGVGIQVPRSLAVAIRDGHPYMLLSYVEGV